MKTKATGLLVCAWLACGPAAGQDIPEDPAHEELRALRGELVEAITRGDIDSVIEHVHPNVVVTWQNAEVCRGHQGLRDFFNRTAKDSFKGYKVPPAADEPTILYGGDTGVAFGGTTSEYNVLGKVHELHSRWTATVVKQDGRWLLAGYHVSMNVLDNPILNTASRSLYWASGGALAAGLLAGVLIARRKKR